MSQVKSQTLSENLSEVKFKGAIHVTREITNKTLKRYSCHTTFYV